MLYLFCNPAKSFYSLVQFLKVLLHCWKRLSSLVKQIYFKILSWHILIVLFVGLKLFYVFSISLLIWTLKLDSGINWNPCMEYFIWKRAPCVYSYFILFSIFNARLDIFYRPLLKGVKLESVNVLCAKTQMWWK